MAITSKRSSTAAISAGKKAIGKAATKRAVIARPTRKAEVAVSAQVSGAASAEAPGAGEAAAKFLVAVDSRFAPMVATQGALSLSGVKSQPTAFTALLKAIVYQQLAAKAAATIYGRVLVAVKADPPTPEAVLATSHDELRGAGLSERKVSYILDLAAHFDDGRLSDELLQTATNDELLTALTAVKGIGPWSCHNFMIFQLCRPDVLPADDYCIGKAFCRFFGLDETKKLSKAEMERLSSAWSPYRSYASYYLWRWMKSSA